MSSSNILSIDQLEGLEADIHEGRCVLIDVRERHEYEAGHIPMSVNRPLSQMTSWSAPMDREQKLILYCRTSNRSRTCAEALRARGFIEVKVLEGGYTAWLRSSSAQA